MLNVEHEVASLPLNQGDTFCPPDSLQYEVFHSYLPQRDFTEDSFFNAIRLMRTVKGAQQHGREVRDEMFGRDFFFVENNRSTSAGPIFLGSCFS